MNENLLDITLLCKELDIGKSTAYKLIKTKQIKRGRIGSKIVIHRKELERFIDSRTQHNGK